MPKRFISFIKFNMRLFNRRNKMLFFFLSLTAIFTIVSTVVMPILQKNIVSAVQLGIADNLMVFLMLAISAVTIGCAIFEALILNKLNIDLQNRLQRELIGSAIRYGSKTIDTRGSGAFLSSVFGDSERIAQLINTNYFSTLLLCLSSLFIIAFTATWSLTFPLVVAPIYLLTLITVTISNKVYAKEFALGREGVMKANPKALERIENRLSILGYANIPGLEAELFHDFDLRDTHFRKAYAAGTLSRTAVSAFQACGLVALFLLSMNQIREGRLNVAMFIAMLSYYASIFVPISAVQNLTQGMESFKLHYDRIQEDLNRPPKVGLPKSFDMGFHHCSFAYENRTEGQIIDLTLPINKNIGLVGLSGEGKTTAIKLLMGNILPQKGKCLLGETEISDISRAILFSVIRLYSQELELFNNTLAYNITLGKSPLPQEAYEKMILEYKIKLHDCRERMGNNQKPTDSDWIIIKELFLFNDARSESPSVPEAIKTALQGVTILDDYAEILVSRKYYITERYQSILEDLGLHHLGGRDLGQHGGKISGGERNKICLARFLLPIYQGFYILDEPLTSVDSISEDQCINAISKYLRCKGGVIISHKLNLIRALSDEICILENGTISEQGTHDALLKSGGLYAKLYEKFVQLK